MRRAVLVAVTVAGVAVPLIAGTALATAKDSRQRVGTGSGASFEIEIDPRLDAKFGPRPVNAVQAAEIVTRQFVGARVIEAELDERDGGPIWEMEFVFGGREREVDVDAVTGAILDDD
ncbi:hypothetical protein E0H26_01680 [Micromonospora zingiberis]|uniref:PepSY domain-containing protein n=1 Tax=Micromonospora zingiberis TaxID=2053011 RepID=A0A4R0GRY3_9ACTN|nr:PepSY domain-containing protein [Micromonospora zingiberis]TCC00427.1 hypothetical protein E0H26_01680 [Micromonospora zingiberis]